MYKLVIPTAGTGSRIENYAKNFNKALVTIGKKPAIAHIIDKFPKAQEIVVPIGYRGGYVKQVLLALYPDRKITFVDVNPYEGDGSGLGYSLNCAKEHLKCPFIFCSNDTIIDEDIEYEPTIHGNWMAYSEAIDEDTSQYRTLNITENTIVSTINKKGVECNNIYIGLCGVKDWKEFWKMMEDDAAISVGESHGLKALERVNAIEIKTWHDTGNTASLEKTRDHFKDYEYNILDKEDEAIWFHNGMVIKFALDEQFIQDRIIRTRFMDPTMTPKIIRNDKNLYVYNREEGKTLSTTLNSMAFIDLLQLFSMKMWDEVPPNQEIVEDVKKACKVFYKDKTYSRVKLFLDKYEMVDREDIINDIDVPKTYELLDSVEWDKLTEDPHVSYYHGDLHNENIISGGDRVILLDWRQNFGEGQFEWGDAYYDLAKLNHGFIVSHDIVNKEQFKVERHDDASVTIDIDRPLRLIEVESTFYHWLGENGFNVKKVKILTALIYLNICGLHDYPYSLFLYYLGKHLLFRELMG